MTPRRVALLATGCLLLGGLGLLWAGGGWRIALGVFLLLWANNWANNLP